jgi:hypothetical protein
MGGGKHGASLLPEHRSRPPPSFSKLSQTLVTHFLRRIRDKSSIKTINRASTRQRLEGVSLLEK